MMYLTIESNTNHFKFHCMNYDSKQVEQFNKNKGITTYLQINNTIL